MSGMHALKSENYMPENRRLKDIRATPLLIYHGEADTKIPLKTAEVTYDKFKKLVYVKNYSKFLKIRTEPEMDHHPSQ